MFDALQNPGLHLRTSPVDCNQMAIVMAFVSPFYKCFLRCCSPVQWFAGRMIQLQGRVDENKAMNGMLI